MRTLGLSFDFHDASIAIVEDGSILSACSEERFSLQKHDASFPSLATSAAFNQLGMHISDMDRIVFYERPHEKFTRILESSFDQYPFGAFDFYRSMKKWLGSSLWKRNLIANELDVSPGKIDYVSHHKSHIAQAFGCSGFKESAVLVVDGVGEWASTTLAVVKDRDSIDSITEIESYDYPNSIGLVYAAFTAFLGFKPNSGESSTMALAGFGKPVYVKQIEKVIRRNNDNTYSCVSEFFDFTSTSAKIFSAKFIELFGEPRNIQKPYAFDALGKAEQSDSDQRYADIAASLQYVFEDIMLGLCARLRAASGSQNLCLSGGVALNCIANTRIMKESGFEQVFIPSEPGDGGAAMGAAYLGNQFSSAPGMSSAYLGVKAEADSISPFLEVDYLKSIYVETGFNQGFSLADISIEKYSDEQTLLSQTVDDLSNGKIVGWVQGRLEFGPRALGNRSLLVDPANLIALRRLSQSVKKHAVFRPYALSMQAEFANRILECEFDGQNLLRWMQSVWPVKENMQEKLRAGLHIDGTTRPQLCCYQDNPRFWKLLKCFGDSRGIPALVNTSFNERGMPIVATSTQALVTFMRTAIDTLVVDDTVIRKIYR